MKRIVWLAAAASLLTAAAASAQPMLTKTSTGFTFDGWRVRTAQFDFNWQTGDFTVPRHIHMSRSGSAIDADRATGNQKQRRATLVGNVVLNDEQGAAASIGASNAPGQPSQLACDQLVVDGVSKLYSATGHVHFTQGASSIRADQGTFNAMTHELDLHGNVHVDE